MRIHHAELICFSPTGTTRTVLEAVARGLDAPCSSLDLTLPAVPAQGAAAGLALIGVPVYAGRVPVLAAVRRRAHVNGDRKSTPQNTSHPALSRMPSSA